MEIYTIAGSIVIALAIGVIGLYLAKDEATLRHKGMLAEKKK